MTRRKRRPPPRVLRHLQPCADCCAEYRDGRLLHELSCPLAAAVERQCDADREWFAAHPTEQYFTRPVAAAEVQTLRHLDPAGAAAAPDHVHVWSGPRGRLRQFCDGTRFVTLAIDPDSGAA